MEGMQSIEDDSTTVNPNPDLTCDPPTILQSGSTITMDPSPAAEWKIEQQMSVSVTVSPATNSITISSPDLAPDALQNNLPEPIQNLPPDASSRTEESDDRSRIKENDDMSRTRESNDMSRTKENDDMSRIKKNDDMSRTRENDDMSRTKENEDMSRTKESDVISRTKESDVIHLPDSKSMKATHQSNNIPGVGSKSRPSETTKESENIHGSSSKSKESRTESDDRRESFNISSSSQCRRLSTGEKSQETSVAPREKEDLLGPASVSSSVLPSVASLLSRRSEGQELSQENSEAPEKVHQGMVDHTGRRIFNEQGDFTFDDGVEKSKMDTSIEDNTRTYDHMECSRPLDTVNTVGTVSKDIRDEVNVSRLKDGRTVSKEIDSETIENSNTSDTAKVDISDELISKNNGKVHTQPMETSNTAGDLTKQNDKAYDVMKASDSVDNSRQDLIHGKGDERSEVIKLECQVTVESFENVIHTETGLDFSSGQDTKTEAEDDSHMEGNSTMESIETTEEINEEEGQEESRPKRQYKKRRKAGTRFTKKRASRQVAKEDTAQIDDLYGKAKFKTISYLPNTIKTPVISLERLKTDVKTDVKSPEKGKHQVKSPKKGETGVISPELLKLCKPFSLKLYDVAPYLNGKTTMSFKIRRGRQVRGAVELIRIWNNQPPEGCKRPDLKRENKPPENKAPPKPYLWEEKEECPTRLRPRVSKTYIESNSDPEEIDPSPVYEPSGPEKRKRNIIETRNITVFSEKSFEGRTVYTLARQGEKIGEDESTESCYQVDTIQDPGSQKKALSVCAYYVADINVEVGKIQAEEVKAEENNVTLMTCSVCHLRDVRPNHKDEEHQSSSTFYLRCHFCGIKFNTQLARNLHAAIHIPPVKSRGQLECSLCSMNLSSGTLHDLQVHCETVHAPFLRYPCPLCPETVVEMNLLQAHIEEHMPEHKSCNCGIRKCYGCMLKDHSRNKGKHSSRLEMRPCDICQLLFKNLTLHLRDHHKMERHFTQYMCMVCEASFVDADVAKLHQRIHAGPLPPLPKYLTCTSCNIAVQSMETHMPKHRSKRVVMCSYCNIGFDNDTMLFLHVRTHLPDECKCSRSACQACSTKTLPVTPELELDAFLDTTQKTECPVCKLHFVDLRSVNKSDYRFPNGLIDLESHIISEHLHKSQYRCGKCRAGFANRQIAMFHMHVHTGLHLPVGNVCSLCKEAQDKVDIASHIVEKHREIKIEKHFKCTVCFLLLPEENLYRSHLLTHLPPTQSTTEAGEEELCLTIGAWPFVTGHRYSADDMKYVCQVCYLCMDNMEEHALEHRPNKARFRCRVCKVTFQTEVLSSTHARIHCYKFPALNLQCSICKARFSTGDSLIKHCTETHPQDANDWTKGFMCNICHSVFPEENSQLAHKSKHNPKFCRCGQKECKFCTYYTCKHCGDFFNPSLKWYYLQHADHCNQEKLDLLTLKRKPANSDSQVIKIARVKPYQCSSPSQLHSQQVSMAGTKSTTIDVTSARRIAIASAGRVVLDSDSAEAKGQVEAQGDVAGEGSSSTECIACGVQIKSGTIAEHFRRHHNKPVNVYTCREPGCTYTAAEAENFLRHRLSHIDNDFFRCMLCKDHFIGWDQLMRHNYNFHFPLHHRCNVCGMYFTNLELLITHNNLNRWAKMRGISCNFCCRSFPSWEGYKIHRTQHQNMICQCSNATCNRCNKFRCACGQRFKAHQFLQYMLHMRTCFRCYACDTTCGSIQELHEHEVQHNLKCAVCGVLRKTERHLAAHMTLHNCHCPADHADCLFCKKAWCSICSQRFLKAELDTFAEHRETCTDAELLCICREEDCIICQNGKCPCCSRTFSHRRFSSFALHVKFCKGETPDPFGTSASASTSSSPVPRETITIKDEPIDLDYTRKRPVVDNTIIDLDSDHENDNDDTRSGVEQSQQPSPFPDMEDQLLEDDTSQLSTPSKSGQDEMSRTLEAEHSEYFRTHWSANFPTDVPLTLTPQTSHIPEAMQPSTSYSFPDPIAPADSNYGVITVAPMDDSTVPQPHGIINICPEGDFNEPQMEEEFRRIEEFMDQFPIVQPVAQVQLLNEVDNTPMDNLNNESVSNCPTAPTNPTSE